MSDYVNEYVESAKEVLASAAKKVVEKSSEIYTTTKLTYEISKLRDEINRSYKELGEMFYANYLGKETSSEEAEEICRKIEALQQKLPMQRDAMFVKTAVQRLQRKAFTVLSAERNCNRESKKWILRIFH